MVHTTPGLQELNYSSGTFTQTDAEEIREGFVRATWEGFARIEELGRGGKGGGGREEWVTVRAAEEAIEGVAGDGVVSCGHCREGSCERT